MTRRDPTFEPCANELLALAQCAAWPVAHARLLASRRMTRRLSGLVLIAGAVVYGALVGAADVTFNSTPLIVGASAAAAGLMGRQRRLVPIGLTLAGWGTAVLLVRDGPVPDDREAPAFLIGMAIGLLAAHLVARVWRLPLTGALLAALTGGLAFYVAYDVTWLGEWPFWTAAVAAWGVLEAARRPEPA